MGRNDIPLSPNIKIWVNKISCITYKYIERGFCLQGSNPILGFIFPSKFIILISKYDRSTIFLDIESQRKMQLEFPLSFTVDYLRDRQSKLLCS